MQNHSVNDSVALGMALPPSLCPHPPSPNLLESPSPPVPALSVWSGKQVLNERVISEGLAEVGTIDQTTSRSH